MSDGQGYTRFPDLPVFRAQAGTLTYARPLWNGRRLDASVVPWSETFQTPGEIVQTAAASSILHLRYVSSVRPVGVSPIEMPFTLRLNSQQDFRDVIRDCRAGIPVEVFFAWPVVDCWLIGAAEINQVNWRTSRLAAWDASTITHATHPPRAWIDTTAQTIVTAAPAAGEVQVPTSQGTAPYLEIRTPLSITGSRLFLEFWPMLVGRIEAPTFSVPQVNELIVSGTFKELRAASASD